MYIYIYIADLHAERCDVNIHMYENILSGQTAGSFEALKIHHATKSMARTLCAATLSLVNLLHVSSAFAD